MKKEVYSWRLTSEIKADLERAARLRKTSVAVLLDTAVRDWLKASNASADDTVRQQQLHAAASQCFGVVASGRPDRAANVRRLIREKLDKRYGR